MNQRQKQTFFSAGLLWLLFTGTGLAQSSSAAQPGAALTPLGVKTGKNMALSAAMAPDHKTLLKLLKASGLLKQAAGKKEYTVFAPTDAAFAGMPESELRELLLPSSRKRLVQLLAYHVVKGRLTSDRLIDGQTLTNITGHTLVIHKQGNTITIEDGRASVADVVQSDIRATNGVIYSINKVLQQNEQ